MTVILNQRKILFVTVPKVACTSIKKTLFKIENGFQFRNFMANGTLRHIHDMSIYPAIAFKDIDQSKVAGFTKYTMVRDPVLRFLSAYSNRVGFYKELSEKNIAGSGLKPDPDIHEFIASLQEYRSASRSIWLHTAPLVVFLGEDPTYYDRIFDISEIADLAATLGVEKISHEQTGGEKIDPAILSSDELSKVINFYAADYRFYGQFMPPPNRIARSLGEDVV